jgi:hypothetical protein
MACYALCIWSGGDVARALKILKPDVPHVLKEALNNSETNERFKISNSSSGGEFKITNIFFTKKEQQNKQ